VREEARAGRQEPHAARRALEERRAELSLEPAYLTRERRLRDVQALRRAADVPFFRHGDEILDLGEAHVASALLPDPPASNTESVLERQRGPTQPRGMRIERHRAGAVARLQAAGAAAAATLRLVGARLREGMSTADIDGMVREHTAQQGARPSQLGYHGFPATVCTSVNDVVCHGVPGPTTVLAAGDIIAVDVTSELDGYHGDTCTTFFVGQPSAEARHVVETARRCRQAGIDEVRDGARLGDIGAAVEALAQAEGCHVVREVGGHGIGRRMHMPPHVPHFGRRGSGRRLRSGMAITIEPIVTLGGPGLIEDADGWTLRSADGALAAQFEHTVLVTRRGCDVLTL